MCECVPFLKRKMHIWGQLTISKEMSLIEFAFCLPFFAFKLHSELLLLPKPVLNEFLTSLANNLVTGIESGSER